MNLASTVGLKMLLILLLVTSTPFDETRCSNRERSLAIAVAKSSTSFNRKMVILELDIVLY